MTLFEQMGPVEILFGLVITGLFGLFALSMIFWAIIAITGGEGFEGRDRRFVALGFLIWAVAGAFPIAAYFNAWPSNYFGGWVKFWAWVALVVGGGASHLWAMSAPPKTKEEPPKPQATPAPPPPQSPLERMQIFAEGIRVPAFMKHQVLDAMAESDQYPPALVNSVNFLAERLPPHGLLAPGGTTWGKFLDAATKDPVEARVYRSAFETIGPKAMAMLREVPVSLTIPEKMRTQHHHIVAGSGQGKTECLKSMIMADVEAGHSVIVIDSQNELINELAVRVPPDRLVLVDPVHCPPPMNLFDMDASSELFEYIFQALDAEMTAKQSTAYRYVSRMVVEAKGNIHTMRDILADGDEWQRHTQNLSETARSFFETQFASRQFSETRKEVHRRLYQLLENETLDAMLGADDCLDMPACIDAGKVILISTAKNHLKQMGASLFGRIFIAQVMNAVIGNKRRRTYLYIDEFQDYAEDSHVLFNLFEQARKYELGVIVAHQYLGQLPQQLSESLSANTAIKFAGGVSAEDARKLASQLRTTADFILTQPKYTFAAYFRDVGTMAFPVAQTKAPKLREISAVREDMRAKFPPLKTPSRYETPESGSEVPERGEW